jgi:TPR repeat protein
MAKRAPREASPEVARVWQQRSTRSAILDAARRFTARNGAPELTLACVADEANFSPNTVYAYFVNKSELMLAIVAEDLAALARQMRDVFPANEDVVKKDKSESENSDDVQGEEHGISDTDSSATETHEPEGARELSHSEEAVSDALPIAEENPAAVPDIEPSVDVPVQVETHDEAQLAPEIAEAAAVEAVPETAAVVEQHETVVADTPAAHQAIEEPVEQHLAPEPVAPAAIPEAEGEITSETTELPPAVDAQADLRPAGMPLVEKKWSLQPDTDRQDEDVPTLARLQESVAKLEARPVDAWLERRLRELERMIASLEERQGTNERSSGAVSGVFEETLRGLQTRMEAVEKNRQLDFEGNAKSFNERMNASEKRLRDMFGELRNLTMMSSSRLDALETDGQKRTTYEHFDSTPVAEFPATLLDAPQVDAQTEKADSPVEPATAPSAEPSYLSQARRSAMAAAAQAVAQPNDSLQRFASTMSSIKTASSGSRYIIAGGLVLLIALLGVGLALKRQAADPDSSGQPPVQVASNSHGGHARLSSGQTMAPQIRLASLAHKGNAAAELLLGLEYLDGTGAAKNESEAAQWISRAAARGDAVAQLWLGTLYANGRGVKADPAAAIHWYEEAAMQGNRKAMHQLAASYAEGWGATRNYTEAARWFSRAASLGYVDSAFNLGVLYERGLGMPQSLLDAYKWYSIAAAMGDKGSPPRLAVLKTQMSADDIADATQAASSFAPDAMDQTANATPQIAQLPKR